MIALALSSPHAQCNDTTPFGLFADDGQSVVPVFNDFAYSYVLLAPTAGTLWPGCHNNDCASYGVQRAYDSVVAGSTNPARSTETAELPYIQLDMGSIRRDISEVLIFMAAEPFSKDNKLQVRLSVDAFKPTQQEWFGGCFGPDTTAGLGNVVRLGCVVVEARYVTVFVYHKPDTKAYISVQEIKVFAKGEPVARQLQ